MPIPYWAIGEKLWGLLSQHCDFIPHLARVRAGIKAREAGMIEAAKLTISTNADRFRSREWEFDFEKGELVKRSADEIAAFDPEISHADRVDHTHQRELARKAANLISVAKMADDEVREGDENAKVTSEPVDEDWFVKWKQGAEEVSQPDLQRIWAAMLVGEIKQPGSNHLRTVQLLQCLTAADLKTIQHVMSFVISGQFLCRDLACLRQAGVSFGKLADLEELGVLGPIDPSGGREWKLTTKLVGQAPILLRFAGSHFLHVAPPNAETNVKVPSIFLTRVGCDLFKIGKFEDPPRYYMDTVANLIGRDFRPRLFEQMIESGKLTSVVVQDYFPDVYAAR
jgi:hypothetical protein